MWRVPSRRLIPVSDGPAEAARDWVIEPVALGGWARFKEVVQYRRLLWYFAVRSTKQLYEKTTLGVFWLFARPLLPILISTFIFGGLLKVPSDGMPYFLFFLTGNSLWHMLERSIIWTTRSFDRQKNIIKKLYFPRVIVPIAGGAPAFVEFAIYLALILLAAFYYLYADHRWYLSFGSGLLLAGVLVLLTALLAAAIGMFTSVWQIRHREVRFTLRYVTRFWFFLTPVIYPMSQVPPHLQWVIYLNPMASIIETFKWALLGVGTFQLVPLLCSVAIIPTLFLLGVWYFTRSEAGSVDEM